MTSAEVLAELRYILDDTVAPYAWTDTRLRRLLAKGQDQFCQDTGFFKDVTTYTIVTVAGTASYTIPAPVIQVNEIWFGDTRLRKFQQGERFSGNSLTPTRSYAWQSDLQTGMITLYPAPDAVYTFQLHVWRKSLLAFDAATTPATAFEIPADHHWAPIEYAAGKAFGDHDRERQDPVKAADHMANYKILAIEGKRAFRRLCAGSSEFRPDTLYVV